MKLLVFGTTGQVARELARRCPDGTALRAVGRTEADLTDRAAAAAVIAAADVNAVVNAAAWTVVDGAEAEPNTAMAVNAHAPEAMARACAGKGIPLVHVSTDYVFDGRGDQPFTPDHPTAPLGVYGASKLAGEEAIRASGAHHAILRTSWVFSAHGANFVKTMLRLGTEREQLNVVADQVGGPTPAAAIADALFAVARGLVDGQTGGTYHFAGAPDVSWAEFAEDIMAAGGRACRIMPIPTSAYPTPARRPFNSRLDCASLLRDFGIARPDWRTAVRTVVRELAE